MAANRQPLYQAPEMRPHTTPAHRRLLLFASLIVAVTAAGSLLGDGLIPAPEQGAQLSISATASRSGRVLVTPAQQQAEFATPQVAIVPAPTAAPPLASESLIVRASAGLHLRSQPAVNAPVAGVLRWGATVTAIGPLVAEDGRLWVPVRAEGMEGWAAAEYLEAAQ
jgi:hypothetical protein